MRILLAEDEALVAADVEAVLLDLGHEVVGPVATVGALERLAANEAVDGAVLDVNLHGVQVFGVLPAILARGIPVILSSGYDDRSMYPDEFRRLPLLVKPYGFADLAALVRSVFGSRGST